MRFDVYLAAARQISREKARNLILAGDVSVNGCVVRKPAFEIEEGAEITVSDKVRYVGRGGYKLEAALTAFQITVKDYVCVDVGASTGGFTDCLLKAGAKLVYAIENGSNQLDISLLNDPRIISLEHTDIRAEALHEKIGKADFAAVDVSFISLTLVSHHVARLLKPGADVVLLIKPQFEAGREHIGKNGVVRNKKVHVEAIRRVIDHVKSHGFTALNLTFSPIKGGEGNIEYLLHTVYSPDRPSRLPQLSQIVDQAFEQL